MQFFPRQILLSTLCISLLAAGVSFAQSTERVSVDSQGTQASDESTSPSISADGRYVAFGSFADDLVSGDTNGKADIFVHDRQTRITKRVSVNSLGIQGNKHSFDHHPPSISADGRYVAFASEARNLVLGDNILVKDIFVHDCETSETERVSIGLQGAEANGGSIRPSISADGRYVAFESRADNLIQTDSNGYSDIFVYDRQTGLTERVSINYLGQGGRSLSGAPSISSDGRFIAFTSSADNLVPGDLNDSSDVFVHDRQTRLTERVSVNSIGDEAWGMSLSPSISAHGRYVVFESWASNLVPVDWNYFSDIFVHDRELAETTLVSVASDGSAPYGWCNSPVISSDGKVVAFQSKADGLVPGNINQTWEVYTHNIQTGLTQRVSVNSQNVEGNKASYRPCISANGGHVAFESTSTNLSSGDWNARTDVFVRDRWNGRGTNSIYLTGPQRSPVGVPLELEWLTSRPNSQYWLIRSMNRNGSTLGSVNHPLDLGDPLTLTATGFHSSNGTGSFSSAPVPNNAMGLTLYFEVVALDAAAFLYDSNAIAVDFY